MMMNIDNLITGFIQRSIEIGDLEPLDAVYVANQLMDILKVENYEKPEDFTDMPDSRLTVLDELVEYAVSENVIDDLAATRDVLSAKIMDLVTPRPSEVNADFWKAYEESPEKATDQFFELSKRNNYIQTRAIAQNIAFTYESEEY